VQAWQTAHPRYGKRFMPEQKPLQEMIKRRDLAGKRAAERAPFQEDVARPIAFCRGADRTSDRDDVPGGYHVDKSQNYHAWAGAFH
jgi:hypothetical protein